MDPMVEPNIELETDMEAEPNKGYRHVEEANMEHTVAVGLSEAVPEFDLGDGS